MVVQSGFDPGHRNKRGKQLMGLDILLYNRSSTNTPRMNYYKISSTCKEHGIIRKQGIDSCLFFVSYGASESPFAMTLTLLFSLRGWE